MIPCGSGIPGSSDSILALNDAGEQIPAGQHVFDLDEAPDEMMDGTGDEFDMAEEEMEEDENREDDSAFASSENGDDIRMADEHGDLPPPHLRPNPISTTDDNDGAITTNLEDDLEDEGYTLPAVASGGEEGEFEEGTSLREVEGRMRWLVGVCMGKNEKVSNGVAGK